MSDEDRTREQLLQELRAEREQRQALGHRLLAVQEDERRRLARALHDGICQTLTRLALTLEGGTAGADAEAQVWLAEAVGQARQLCADLLPPMLDPLGLLPALLWFVEGFSARTGVRVHFRHEGLGARLGPHVETAAYRLVQEALTNVARHAGVGEATVRAWTQDGWLHVQIEDEGAGFDAEAVLASGANAGLVGMRERVRLLGGELSVDSAPGEGTHLLARLPLEP